MSDLRGPWRWMSKLHKTTILSRKVPVVKRYALRVLAELLAVITIFFTVILLSYTQRRG
jgi:hypothetical protein